MKKSFALLYLCLIIFSCAQKELKKEEIVDQENIKKVENIYKEVKVYDYNPQYTLHIKTAANFSFEILINDFPIQQNYESGIVTGSVPINEALLKKGKQRLTVKMTPPVDKQFKMGTEIDLAIAELKLHINYGDYGKEKAKDFKTALTYEMKHQDLKLPYYEINLEFDVPELPYENEVEGWSEGVDLTKEDKDKLQIEVEDFYRNIIKLYETKNVNGLASKYYKRQKELGQIHYQDKPGNYQVLIDTWIKDANDERPFVFKDNLLKFYGNGRVLMLVQTDKYYINSTSLMREDADGNYVMFYMALYRPKPGAPLEVIR